jgi:phosphohistidine phosphatase
MLHLVRHAHAVSAGENPLRPLSPRGRAQAAQLAAFFRSNGQLRPVEIWHSPLARARETAVLLAHGLGFTGRLVETPGLEPEDDPQAAAARLHRAPDGLVIVGHEPHLSALAGWLLCGRDEPPLITMKKAASLALEQDGDTWSVRWLLGPELIGPEPDDARSCASLPASAGP